MKPFGHHKVAEDAGLPLMMEAFGADHRALGAFYLGNWIADFSQLVDPAAMESLSFAKNRKALLDKLWTSKEIAAFTEGVTDIFKQIYTDDELKRCEEPGFIPKSLYDLLMVPDKAMKNFEDLSRKLNAAFNEIFVGQTDSRDFEIGQIMREIFFVIGYFQFVYEPELTQTPDPFLLTMGEFKAVFGDPGKTAGTRVMPGQPGGVLAAPATPGAYTQYYPHEHYDRPIIPGDSKTRAPGEQKPDLRLRLGVTPNRRTGDESLPPGPRAVTSKDTIKRSGNHAGPPKSEEKGEPDLYSYLRDYMEGTAGLLAELDDEFAAALAAPPTPAGRGGSYDAAWVKTLAKAGHTLHQVEDFFAHSNFVELAVQRLGRQDHFLRVKDKDDEDKDHGAEVAHRIFSRRLKRYLDNIEENNLQREDWVVTGYFDPLDTIVAIIHTMQDHQRIWGTDDPHDPGKKGGAKDPLTVTPEDKEHQERFEKEGTPQPDIRIFKDPKKAAIDYLASPLKQPAKDSAKAMFEMYRLVADPKAAMNDPDNDVARVLRTKNAQVAKELEEGIKPYLTEADINTIVAGLPPLEGVPPEVMQSFANIYIAGSNFGAHKDAAMSKLEAVWLIEQMIFNPVSLLADELVSEYASGLRYWVQDTLLTLAQADRIGCHSLMAKDHVDAVLHEPMWHCAAVVHSHVIKVLVRDRAMDPPGKAVDWLELLEAMLRNPETALAEAHQQRHKVVTFEPIIHIVKRGEQLDTLSQGAMSLTRRYAPSSRQGRYRPYNKREPKGGFHWRMIADANDVFGTKGKTDAQARGMINNHLRSIGAPRVGANYALKPGMRLTIPDQKKETWVMHTPRADVPWWEKLLNQDKPDFSTLTAKRDEDSENGHTPQFMDRSDFDAMIARGKYLREVFREFYRPVLGPGGSASVPGTQRGVWPRAK